MANPWTIGKLGAPQVAVDTLLISKLERTLHCADADSLTFEVAGPGDAAPIWAYKDTVVLQKNGVQWFSGPLLEPKGKMKGSAESVSYKIAGPWWWLEQIVFQQVWADQTAASGRDWRSRAILFQDDPDGSISGVAGGPISVAQQIAAILNYAISCFPAGQAPFAVGNIPTTGYGIDALPNSGVFPVPDEVNSLSCAECVKRCLKWIPDVAMAVAYSGGGAPVITFTQRSLAAATLISIDGVKPTSLEIAPRNDLLCSEVVLNYEVTSSVNGNAQVSTTQDAYPPGSTGQAPSAIVTTVSMGGTQMSFEQQPIQTSALLTKTASDADIIQFFTKKCPELNGGGANQQGIDWEDIELVPDTTLYAWCIPNMPAFGGTPAIWANILADPLTYLPRELVKGSITDWMWEQNSSLAAGWITIAALLSYKVQSTQPDSDERQYANGVFNISGNADADSYNTFWATYSCLATNCVTQTYSELTGYSAPEPIPTGLARYWHDCLNALHYEGSLVLTEPEVSGAVAPASVLNIGNSAAEWARMNAVVQSVKETIDTGETEITFGPPEHLTPQDFVELLRAMRIVRSSVKMGERTTGDSGSVTTVSGTGVTPGNNPNSPRSPILHPWISDSWDSDANNNPVYSAWLGAPDSGDADFVPDDANPVALTALALQVCDPNDLSAASALRLVVGDSDPENDKLELSANGAGWRKTWASSDDGGHPNIDARGWSTDSDPDNDIFGNAIWQSITQDGDGNYYPLLAVTDNLDSYGSANRAYAMIDQEDNGPVPTLAVYDDQDNYVKAACDTQAPNLSIGDTNGEIVRLGQDDDGNYSLEINDEAGYVSINQAAIKLGYDEDGTPGLELPDEGYVQMGNTTLSDGDLDLSGDDGTNDGTIELGSGDGAQLTVGQTTLSSGDLDLGDDGTIEIGSSGSVTVGSSVLSDGDLDLGGSGTITIDGTSYSPQTVSICNDDGSTSSMQVLGTDPS